jgi:hypothetical protein
MKLIRQTASFGRQARLKDRRVKTSEEVGMRRSNWGENAAQKKSSELFCKWISGNPAKSAGN